MTTVGEFLEQYTHRLRRAGIVSARLDCLILLEDTLSTDRAHILAHPEQILTPDYLTRLREALRQRERHVPLAYIRGKVAFFGRTFTVNRDVLIPRPESEDSIEILKSLPFAAPPRIADIGTGSGALGITAALELPASQVYLYDIGPLALMVARSNATRLGATVTIDESDLLHTAAHNIDIIIANLPYVPLRYHIDQATSYEPQLALFSGDDGLELYRRLWQQLQRMATKPGYVIVEAFPFQHDAQITYAEATGYICRETRGFVQLFSLKTPPSQ